jgi:hypothetical protein
MIAVDPSLVDYSLKWAIHIEDDQEVNYICNRIIEIVPTMQKSLCMQLMQRVKDQAGNDWDYLKTSPIERLFDSLKAKLEEYKDD